ncbi:MAG TPA: hypothetical protein VFF65_10415 [Phycisphaerales bacterium]|nr:hypothetical protein [Phycisphaerales bacterium]
MKQRNVWMSLIAGAVLVVAAIGWMIYAAKTRPTALPQELVLGAGRAGLIADQDTISDITMRAAALSPGADAKSVRKYADYFANHINKGSSPSAREAACGLYVLYASTKDPYVAEMRRSFVASHADMIVVQWCTMDVK